MTREEFEYLRSDQARTLIERHIGDDPLKMALDGLPAPVCTQVKLLGKCRAKLPDYYDRRCIVTRVGFEQSSSRATAFSRGYSGETALDLTCGLGCDAYALSRSFRRVVTVERDALLADIARYNFSLLGCGNIEVVCADSAEYVERLSGRFDMVYIDPARRDTGRRVFLLQDCSPDVTAMASRLVELSDRVVIKASPLFDVDEAERLLSVYGMVDTNTVSVCGECKETIVELMPRSDGTGSSRSVTVISHGTTERYSFSKQEMAAAVEALSGRVSAYDGEDATDDARSLRQESFAAEHLPDKGNASGGSYADSRTCGSEPEGYILLPDAAFVKSRTVEALAARLAGVRLDRRSGVMFSDKPSGLCALRSYKIGQTMPFRPKALKKLFKERGIVGVTIIKRGIGMSVEETRARLGVKEGSDATLILCGDRVYFVE